MIYATNKKSRTELRNNPHSVLSYIDKDIDIVVKTNTKNIIYVVFPSVINMQLTNITAAASDAAGTAGSVSTIGSASTYGTVSSVGSTAGSLSSVGSAGSVGSASTKGCS